MTATAASGPACARRSWSAAAGSTPAARRCRSPTCGAGSWCSTSGPSAASTACTSSTSCGPSRSSTRTRSSSSGCTRPKFEHEADPDALAAAVERYAVHHPVLDDPELVTWQAYTARAWPTLVVIDPEGYIVASMSGEGHAHGLSVLVEELVEEHSAKGTLRQGDSPYAAPPPAETALRFPGKVAVLPDGSFLVSDTAHHEIVWLESDLVTERRRFGDERPPANSASSTSRKGCSCCRPSTAATGRLRRRRRRLGQPPGQGAAPGRRRVDPPGRHRPAAARTVGQRPRPQAGPLDPLGPGLVHRPGRHRDGRDPPAVGPAPGHGPGRQHGRRARRHLRRGHP